MTAVASAARSRFDKDVAWSAFAMLVPIAVGLLALPLIFRNVHQHDFTLFLLFFGAVSFAPSLDLGVARAAGRRVAAATSLGAATRAVLVHHSLRGAAIVATAMAVLTSVGAFFLFPSQGDPAARIGLAMVTGMGVALAIHANCQRGILEGLGAFSRSALNRAGVGIALVGLPVAVSFVVRDATMLSLSAVMIRLPFIWEQRRAIRATLTRDAADGAQRHDVTAGFMRESGWFALLAALAVAMSGFDRYILMGWGGLSGQSLTVFLATQDLALRAIALPAALLPALAVRLADGEIGALARRLSHRLFLFVVPGVMLGCMGGAIGSRWIVHLLYPLLPVDDAAAALRILFLGIAASAVAQFPMARLAAAGRARDAALMHGAELVVYLALVPVLIERFGALGGAALWSGRIILDAALLIAWNVRLRGDRAALLWEGSALLGGIAALMVIEISI